MDKRIVKLFAWIVIGAIALIFVLALNGGFAPEPTGKPRKLNEQERQDSIGGKKPIAKG